ncbi:MAG: NUDIX domain-containing protein [Ardenticatenales bacterium]
MPLDPPARAALDALLAGHRPADDAEAADLAAIRSFVAASDAPFDRRTLPGHLTGSAFIIDTRTRLLMVHHRRLGLWLQLGGHADFETDAAVVAMREAVEESGLVDLRFHEALRTPDGRPALLDVDVHAIPAFGAEPPHVHFDLRFLMTTDQPDRISHQPSESHGLEWLSLAEARARGDAGIGRALDKIARLTVVASVPEGASRRRT